MNIITNANGSPAAIMDSTGGSTPVAVKFNGDDPLLSLQRRLDRVEVKMEDLRSIIAIQQGTIAGLRDEVARLKLAQVAR